MNSSELSGWAWVGFKIALAIIMTLNLKRVWNGFTHIFGSDGIDKKELGGVVLLVLGIYMVWLEGHRTDITHQLFTDWLYLIVFGGAMTGLGLRYVVDALTSVKNGVVLQKDVKDAGTEQKSKEQPDSER